MAATPVPPLTPLKYADQNALFLLRKISISHALSPHKSVRLYRKRATCSVLQHRNAYGFQRQYNKRTCRTDPLRTAGYIALFPFVWLTYCIVNSLPMRHKRKSFRACAGISFSICVISPAAKKECVQQKSAQTLFPSALCPGTAPVNSFVTTEEWYSLLKLPYRNRLGTLVAGLKVASW